MDSSRRGALGDSLKPVAEMARTDYRPGFIAAIDQALRLKPEERPQSIGEWRLLLMAQTATAPGTDGDKAARDKGVRKAEEGSGDPGRSTEEAGNTGGKGGIGGQGGAGARRPARRTAAVIGGVAILALAGMGAVALWRVPPPPLPRPDPIKKADVVTKAEPVDVKTGPITPLTPDPEQAAQTAWAQLANTTDPAAIERFLELHGTTARAGEARARLAALRDAARRADAAKAEADRAREAAEQAQRAETAAADAWERVRQTTDPAVIEQFIAAHGATRFGIGARARLRELTAEANRQRGREAAWTACQAAPDAAKIALCTRVIDSDDIGERRAVALQLRGNAERKAGNFDNAISDLTRSLDLVPGKAQVLTDRGVAYFLRGGAANQQAALNDYDAAIRVEPRHAEALNDRAWAVFQAGRTAEALADANRSIEAVATNGYAYDTRGQILEKLGRREEAIRDYERALQLDPSQETSRAGLQRLRAAKK
jgi:tetratricopeptide (TPR) repeat protein